MSTVDELEARIAQLEAQVGQPAVSTLQPNVLTVAPDGTIGADFTGLVNALGLILPTGTLALPAPDSLATWQDARKSSASSGFISGLNVGSAPSTSKLIVRAVAEPATDQAILSLEADSQQPGTDGHVAASYIQIIENGSTSPAVGTGKIIFATPNNTWTLMEDDGGFNNVKSSFLQLLSAQRLYISWGSASVAIPNGWSTQSVGFTAFPTAASFAFAWPEGGIGASILSWNPSSFNNGSISVNINTNTAQTITFRAIAFGT